MVLGTGGAIELPHIDVAPTEVAIASAKALIEAEMEPGCQDTLHPLIPALRSTSFGLIESEHARLASSNSKQGGIDLTSYEALDAPETGDLQAWQTTLQRAYVSAEYMTGREVNLGLLEAFGKNAWLVGNRTLEDTLQALEKEVELAKQEQEMIDLARRTVQTSAQGEMQSLDEAWRTGLARMIETQAAAEGLRQDLLSKQRQGVC